MSDWPTASAAGDSSGVITHVTDVGAVARVRSQHAVEEVVVGPALHAHQRAGLTEGGRGGGARKVVTFWKMKRDGKVLEMSSLIRSRLDSLSATDAASTTNNTFRIRRERGGGVTASYRSRCR